MIPYVFSTRPDNHKEFLKEGLLNVNQGGNGNPNKWGFIDTTGKIVIRCVYDDVDPFKNGLSKVSLQQSNDYRIRPKYGYISKTGEEVIPCIHNDLSSFSEGLTSFEESVSGKSGYFNETGSEVIPAIYSVANNFHEGVAWVSYNGRKHSSIRDAKYGLINKLGNVILPFEYFDPGYFSDGLCAVRKQVGGKVSYIDIFGNEIISKISMIGWKFENGVAQVLLNNKWGLVNKSGILVVPYMYDYI